jgi:xylulokinase
MIHSFAFCLPGRWYRMAAMLNGARPLAWFAGVAGRDLADLLAEAAASRPDRAPLFLPYLSGERTPHGDAQIRGGFLGLADDTDAPAMMRGVVEAVAYSFADAHAALGGPLGAPLAVGGGAESDLLLQSIADALEIPIRRPDEAVRGAAYGAARLAAYGAGAIDLADLAAEPAVARVFHPDPAARGRHQARLSRYRAFYRAVKGV